MKDMMKLALRTGFSTAMTASFFMVGGHWLDKTLGTSPAFIFLGAILGVLASLYVVYQIVKPLVV
jgi:hypothetical protein